MYCRTLLHNVAPRVGFLEQRTMKKERSHVIEQASVCERDKSTQDGDRWGWWKTGRKVSAKKQGARRSSKIGLSESSGVVPPIVAAWGPVNQAVTVRWVVHSEYQTVQR